MRATTRLFLGCGSLFVIVLLLAGIAAYLSWHALAPALKTASDTAEVANNITRSVRQRNEQTDALKSLLGGGKPQIATLSRAQLKAFLPRTVGKLKRSAFDTTSGTMIGISGTNAVATYVGTGNGSVEVTITDAANASGATALANLMMNVESDNDNGFDKNVDLAGTRVHERWQISAKHADILAIVGGRFFVEVSSSHVALSTAQEAFESIDVATLGSIAASTAQR